MSHPFESVALEIDAACDRNDAAALAACLNQLTATDRGSLPRRDQALLDFYTANAYAGIRHAEGDHQTWAWDQPHLEKEIYHLRLAMNALADTSTWELKTDLKLRVVTNLANALDHVGRFVEAIELWDGAISEHPRFAMAVGNRAQALFWYARFIKDSTEQGLFLRESHAAFRAATLLGVEPHAQEHIRRHANHLRSLADWDAITLDYPTFRTGSSKLERSYRIWCVRTRLVLSPLNDLSRELESLQDTLTLPDIIIPVREGSAALPKPFAIFNQLKQEFASARFLVFDAIREKDKPLHFADRGLVLYDALDYRYYRLWVEKLKMAFLATHAILDKIAYLVNDYWKLGLGSRSTNFNSIWYVNGRVNLGLSKRFDLSRNWAMRGLYWLSKDVYYKSIDINAVDPDAKVLHDIRNHIAHKYLRVHDHVLYDAAEERARSGHELSFPVSDFELQVQSIKLLKLVRSALIYLTSAIAHEEAEKPESAKDQLLMPMPITIVEDRYRL